MQAAFLLNQPDKAGKLQLNGKVKPVYKPCPEEFWAWFGFLVDYLNTQRVDFYHDYNWDRFHGSHKMPVNTHSIYEKVTFF
jgi:hypothetical protein